MHTTCMKRGMGATKHFAGQARPTVFPVIPVKTANSSRIFGTGGILLYFHTYTTISISCIFCPCLLYFCYKSPVIPAFLKPKVRARPDLVSLLGSTIWKRPFWVVSNVHDGMQNWFGNVYSSLWEKKLKLLRSAVGMTHSLRSDLWWTIILRNRPNLSYRAVVDNVSRQCRDTRDFRDCRHTILPCRHKTKPEKLGTSLSRQSRLSQP